MTHIFWCTGWNTKERRKAGFSFILDTFAFYFWSRYTSGRTSINVTKVNSLTTKTWLLSEVPKYGFKLQLWERQTKIVLSYLTQSPTFHFLSYRSIRWKRTSSFFESYCGKKCIGWIWKWHRDGVSISIFPMPWQLSVLPLANSILCSQANRILGNMLSFINSKVMLFGKWHLEGFYFRITWNP